MWPGVVGKKYGSVRVVNCNEDAHEGLLRSLLTLTMSESLMSSMIYENSLD